MTSTICSSSGVKAAIALAHSSNPRTRRSAALQIAALFDAQLPNVAMLPDALPRAPDLVEMPNSASSYSTGVRLPPGGTARQDRQACHPWPDPSGTTASSLVYQLVKCSRPTSGPVRGICLRRKRVGEASIPRLLSSHCLPRQSENGIGPGLAINVGNPSLMETIPLRARFR